MGKPSAPRPPDPQQTIAQQQQSNLQTGQAQQGLNLIGQSSPFGSLNYQQSGTWADGTPRYQATTSLSGPMASVFGQATQNLSQPLDLSGLPGIDLPELQTSLGADDFSADRQRVEDALMGRLNTQLDRDRSGLEQRLANSGITIGSTAYNRAMDDHYRGSNDARTSAILGAGQEQNRLQQLALNAGMFGNQALQQNFQNQGTMRDRSLGEMLMQRQLPMQEMGSLFGMAPNFGFQQTPQAQIGGTNVAGILGQGYQNQLQQHQQQMQPWRDFWGGITNVAGAAIPHAF